MLRYFPSVPFLEGPCSFFLHFELVGNCFSKSLQHPSKSSIPTFVKNVFLNVVGRNSTLAETAYYVDILDSGRQTKADLLVMASNVEDFQTTINLVGLQTTGVEYTPFTI